MTKPYRPSNGTEGEMFQFNFCDQCAHDAEYRFADGAKGGCQILANALAFGVGDKGFPHQWVEDDDGSNPRCTIFERDYAA